MEFTHGNHDMPLKIYKTFFIYSKFVQNLICSQFVNPESEILSVHLSLFYFIIKPYVASPSVVQCKGIKFPVNFQVFFFVVDSR